ncbi:hypothetical protein [Flammeovirga kamogawensis]|uniref:DUF4958 domain-containing protein n=1 Tax=Flammeovirga kamogawensis TaxID=373891 RepID=A0ABX8H122_9BACT|nr:hypothetical protein [Flammeovirga kamogawensis]MBB6462286.1 hypothetical protein [Flammeovirga kamogawensis]QWG09323.1 hypothetical protein KM029_22215 [Flammeovirga kamogawensis]TRX64845.1 hypothetical protein EO216_20125 [Flammeovirga kamogawensis]
MNRNLTKLLITLAGLLMFMSCEKPTAFMESSEVPTDINITGLSYSEILNARAYSEITTDVPTVNSKGIPCEFEILSVRSADSLLDDSYLEKVSIASARLDTAKVVVDIVDTEVEKVDKDGNVVLDDEGNKVYVQDTTFYYTPVIDPNKAGQIYIEDGNMFSEGDYYFTLRLKPATDGDNSSNTKVFEDAFHLNVMPLLPTKVSYAPVQQNLVIGAGSETTAPSITFSKPVPSYDVRFELNGLQDTLMIDSLTGAISVDPKFTITKNEAFSPSIKVISNITEEDVDFQLNNEELLIVVSEEAIELNVGPLVPTALIYFPFAQNLVLGDVNSVTTAPDIGQGNKNVSFSLGSDFEKFVIDGKTGQLGIRPSYTSTLEVEEVAPIIVVTSDISYESKQYEGVLNVFISQVPYEIPRTTINFFYPTLIGRDGFSLLKTNTGGVGTGLLWKEKTNHLPPADLITERPEDLTTTAVYIHNVIYGPARSPEHETLMVIDAQNLSQYSKGWELSAIFWMKNDNTLYQADGSKAADIEILVTDNYDWANTEWTMVNDLVKFKIAGEGDEYTGTPYPGNQLGADPDGKKDSSRNTYQQWIRYELDLGPYKDQTKFTLAFRYKTYYTGDFTEGIDGTTANFANSSGKFVFSDINYVAVEEVK